MTENASGFDHWKQYYLKRLVKAGKLDDDVLTLECMVSIGPRERRRTFVVQNQRIIELAAEVALTAAGVATPTVSPAVKLLALLWAACKLRGIVLSAEEISDDEVKAFDALASECAHSGSATVEAAASRCGLPANAVEAAFERLAQLQVVSTDGESFRIEDIHCRLPVG
jgi:hypothetical protein